LHIVGTTFTTLYLLNNPLWLISFATALALGFVACEMLIALPHGAVEGALMILSYLALNRFMTGRSGWQPALIGYGFAWVGHFFFEMNRPGFLLSVVLGSIPLNGFFIIIIDS
jgi:uncharacterized membrane protein YGL010W